MRLDKALFSAGGAALGGIIGSFIPIPVIGTLLGGFIGEYIGDLAYMIIRVMDSGQLQSKTNG